MRLDGTEKVHMSHGILEFLIQNSCPRSVLAKNWRLYAEYWLLARAKFALCF
jgi:hypothetical protein